MHCSTVGIQNAADRVIFEVNLDMIELMQRYRRIIESIKNWMKKGRHILSAATDQLTELLIKEAYAKRSGIHFKLASLRAHMYYRISAHEKSSGLGLYIVRDAVWDLNGTIEVESGVNEGSTFIIILPHYVDGIATQQNHSTIKVGPSA